MPFYIISFLSQSSNTLSAMKMPSFSGVISSLSMRAFLMRSILDLLPNGLGGEARVNTTAEEVQKVEQIGG